MSPKIAVRILASLLILLVIWLLRVVAVRIVSKQIDDVRRLYKWRRTISYLLGFLALLLVGRIWLPGLEQVGVFLGLASAGLAIALREPLSGIAGWVFILLRRPFVVGDRIEFGGHVGDVIDIRMFQTYMLECRNWIDGDQSTGRILLVPNGTVFSSSLANYTHGFEYIWDEIFVRLTFESDWQRAKEILTEIVNEQSAPHCEDAQRQIQRAANHHMIFYQKLTPIVYTSVKEWGVQLTVRYLTPPRQRRGSMQQLWEAVLEAFAREKGIQFAYPPTRFYMATEAQPAGLSSHGVGS